jgi:hypothetical protein
VGQEGSGRTRGIAAALLAVLGTLAPGATIARAAESTVIGQWRFDEAAGQTAIDDGQFGLDGRLGASSAADSQDPQRVPGLSGGALRFDGRTFVRLPAAQELTPATLTVEAVVRAPASPGTFRYVVSHGAEDCIAASYGLYTAYNGGLAFYVFDGRYFRISAEAAPSDVWNGGWHHAAGVYDGHALRFYLDGHPVGDPISAPEHIAYALTSTDAYFGTYQGTCARPLVGDVDLVRLWRGPLSADFVGGLSDAALTPPPAPAPPPPSRDAVPVAPPGAEVADAPASRSVLAPIAPGTIVSPGELPAARTSPAATAPASAPGAPPRACVVRPSVRRLRAGRTVTLTVTVALRRKPLDRAHVIATYGAPRRTLARARTQSNGRARLRLTTPNRGAVRLLVVGRQDCSPVALRVFGRR